MKNFNKMFFWMFFIQIFSMLWSSINYNIDLITHVSEIAEYNSNSDFGVSDVWGYTDETGVEYAIVGYRYGTFIFDVSTNPNNPILIADIIGPSEGDYYFHRDYKTYNDHLYIVNEMYGIDVGMQIIDLSPLPNGKPLKRNTYTQITQSHNLWIDIDLGFGFIEKNYPENIHVVDFVNPDNPTHNANFNYQDGENCHDIYTVNNMAFISEGYNYQFGIYDISNILEPTFLASIPSFGYAHNAWLNTAGTHLVTGEETVGMTIKIWDVQNFNNINMVGEYLGENSLTHNVHVKDDFLYVSHYTSGLKILDIFNPADPIEVAAYDTYPDNDSEGFYGCWGAFPFSKNNFIYASDMQYGLFVFEFNNIQAGWAHGNVIKNHEFLSGVKIISLLNEKVFISNFNGEYAFGFPAGIQEFQIFQNDILLDTILIPLVAHEIIEHDIILDTYGDANGDDEINILDVIFLINQILSNEYTTTSDLNADGVINILDIIQLINLILY